jgi:hypothetical protein
VIQTLVHRNVAKVAQPAAEIEARRHILRKALRAAKRKLMQDRESVEAMKGGIPCREYEEYMEEFEEQEAMLNANFEAEMKTIDAEMGDFEPVFKRLMTFGSERMSILERAITLSTTTLSPCSGTRTHGFGHFGAIRLTRYLRLPAWGAWRQAGGLLFACV